MSMAVKYGMQKKAKMMAAGGMVSEEEASGYAPCAMCEDGTCTEHVRDDDLVGRAMKRRMAEGGEVKPLADEEDADYDVLDEEMPAPTAADETGADSGDELDDEAEDHERSDIVSRVMRSRAKKDRNPRPA